MSIKINDVDQEMCGHFFWDLAQQAIRHNFPFDFGAAANTRSNTIDVDEFEAHHTIVTRAFDYLNDEPTDQSKAIGSFLVFWLPYHLDRLRHLEDEDKGSLMPGQRLEIGRSLYNLFKDDQVFTRHRDSFKMTYWTEERMRQVKTWLMDSAVQLRRLAPKWLDEVQEAVNPVRGFLKTLVETVLKGFLRERSWDVQNAYNWIKEFMTVVSFVWLVSQTTLYIRSGRALLTNDLHQDIKRSSETLNTTTDDASSSSSSASSSVEIDWGELSKWCQDYLALPNSALDSLWYERLAEVASSQGSKAETVLSLYRQALKQESPSWLCYRGIGETYFRLEKTEDAIAQVEVALGKADQDGATPKPDKHDFANLHLMLGEYAYRAGDAPKAAHHYQEACMSDDEGQVMKGQLGHLKAVLDLQDPEVKVKLLQSLLAQEDGKTSMVDLLKMIARDSDHDHIMSKIFAVSRGHRDLFKAIIQALETATANFELGEYRASEPLSDARFAEEESRGVLLYYRAIAAYKYKVSPGDTEPVGIAVKLWMDCRDQLSGVGGSNASVVRQDATRELAKHYFHNMMDGEHRDDIGMLSELADVDSKIIITDPSSYLAALYALRGDRAQSRVILGPRVEFGLEILSDNEPENDRAGLYLISNTLLQYGDLKNAAIATSLKGQPDLVTEALHLEAQDVAEVDEAEKGRGLEILTKLSRETIKAAKTQVPDASQQLQRLDAAKLHIESLLGDKKINIDARDDYGGHESTVLVCITALANRLSALRRAHEPDLDKTLIYATRSCDGRLQDGRQCGFKADFHEEFFHCIYCVDKDFCADCFRRLRDPHDSVLITACSPQHRWLRIPPLGHDMYVGPRAKTVRIPSEVRALESDEKILEILYAEEGEGQEIRVEEWKAALAKEWDVEV